MSNRQYFSILNYICFLLLDNCMPRFYRRIAPAVATYMINELLNSNNSDVRKVAQSRNWHIFPVVNPDGYVYTHTHNRLWRKTRAPYWYCYGADLNRNWGYHWNDGGSSTNECSDKFGGPFAFSEIETRYLGEHIDSIAQTLDTFLALHSYSQSLLVPFGHAGDELRKNNNELLRFGRKAAIALSQRYGTIYTVGNYPSSKSSGTSMDWVAGIYENIRLAYTYDLRDTGRYGYLVPPEEIIPSGEEILDSVISLIKQADMIP